MKLNNTIDNAGWLAKNYGSRSGFIKTIGYQLLDLFGVYGKYKKIDWSRVERLVFVCKGNICRSAYAETVATALKKEVFSFGLETKGNAPAHPEAIQIAEACGYDLSQHKTTPLAATDFREGDLLVAMEPWQMCRLKKMFNNKYQYTLLGLWVNPALPYLHDPYGMPTVYFEKCFTIIQQGVYALAGNMEQ